MLVESHGNAVARTAHGYAGETLARLNSFGARMREIGVIARVGTIGAEIFILDAVGFEVALDNAFQFKACVVAAYGERLVGRNN